MAEFTTAVSEVTDGAVNIRGYSQEEIMRHLTYAEGAHLTLIGRLPTPEERRIVDVYLTCVLDHGFVASTITAARYIASGNPQFVPAVAGGLLAAGQNTLSPEHSYEFIEFARLRRAEGGLTNEQTAEDVIKEWRATGRRLPGFGHPVHKDGDFRAAVLIDTAVELGLAGDAVELYLTIHKTFLASTGKNLPINIDGAMAAVALDLGWSCQQVAGFALLSVLPGLMAHVIEELDGGRPLRHITDGAYQVEELRPLPHKENTSQNGEVA